MWIEAINCEHQHAKAIQLIASEHQYVPLDSQATVFADYLKVAAGWRREMQTKARYTRSCRYNVLP